MRRYLIFILIFCLCAVAGLVFLLNKKNAGKKYIAFYSLPADTVEVLQTALKDRFSEIEQSFEWKIIDPALSVTEFMEKNPQTAFIFSYDNRSLFEARRFFIRHEEPVFQVLPSTFLNSIFARDAAADTYYAFPLLIDPVKFACNAAVADTLGMRSYMTRDDLERFCRAAKGAVSFPFVCAGGEDEQLLAMISAVAAMQGAAIAPEALSRLGKEADLHNSCPPVLKDALTVLIEWRQQGFLHPEWFRLLENDVAVFMEFNAVALAAMPLSASRRLKEDILQRFTAVQVPLPPLLSKKNMPAKTIVWTQAVLGEKEKTAVIDAVRAIRDFLYAQETDELLAQATGLAPAFSAAQTQDYEAASGRYWVASANTTLPFFGDIVCTSAAEKARLADGIRRYLEVDGAGY